MSPTAAYLNSLISILRGRLVGNKERGATAVEYGLMVGLIAAVIITVVALLGTTITAFFQSVADEL
jgi:pilus assembly protein Flp/PilA